MYQQPYSPQSQFQTLPFAQQTVFAPQRIHWKGFTTDSKTGQHQKIFWHNLSFHPDGKITGGATTQINGRPTVYHLAGAFGGDGSFALHKTINGVNVSIEYKGRVVGSNRVQGFYNATGPLAQSGTFDMVCDAGRWEGAITNYQSQVQRPVQMELSITAEGVFGVNWTPLIGLYFVEGSYNISNHTMLLNIHFKGMNGIRRVQGQVTHLHGQKIISGNYQDSTQEVGQIKLTKNENYQPGTLGASPGFGPEQGGAYNPFEEVRVQQTQGNQYYPSQQNNGQQQYPHQQNQTPGQPMPGFPAPPGTQQPAPIQGAPPAPINYQAFRKPDAAFNPYGISEDLTKPDEFQSNAGLTSKAGTPFDGNVYR